MSDVFQFLNIPRRDGAKTPAEVRRVQFQEIYAPMDADQAREQTRRCLAELTEARARALSTGALYRLLALGKHFGLGVADPQLRALALDLLPPESRGRL